MTRKKVILVFFIFIIGVITGFFYFTYKWNLKNGINSANAISKEIFIAVNNELDQYDPEFTQDIIISSEKEYWDNSDTDNKIMSRIKDKLTDIDMSKAQYLIIIEDGSLKCVVYSKSRLSPYSGGYPDSLNYVSNWTPKTIRFKYQAEQAINKYKNE